MEDSSKELNISQFIGESYKGFSPQDFNNI